MVSQRRVDDRSRVERCHAMELALRTSTNPRCTRTDRSATEKTLPGLRLGSRWSNRALRRTENPRVGGSIPPLATTSNFLKRNGFPASPADYLGARGAEIGRPSDYRKSGRSRGPSTGGGAGGELTNWKPGILRICASAGSRRLLKTEPRCHPVRVRTLVPSRMGVRRTGDPGPMRAARSPFARTGCRVRRRNAPQFSLE